MDAESGAPKDELHPETITWLKTLGLEYKKLPEILAAGPCPKVTLFKYSLRMKLCSNQCNVSFYFRTIGSISNPRWNKSCQQTCNIKRTKDPKIHHSSARLFNPNG